MVKRIIIKRNRILQVEKTSVADGDILSHIKSIILGTPGRLRYQQKNIEEKIRHINNIQFIVLTRQGKIIGTVGLIERSFLINDTFVKNWYVRYFSIRAPLRSSRQKGKYLRNPEKGSNLIRDTVIPFAENPLRLNEKYDPKEKSMVYAYVESMNIRSLNFTNQMNAVTVRKYRTFIFSRIFPEIPDGFRKLPSRQYAEMKEKIREFYKEYNFFTEENLLFNDHYFVLEKDGNVVAGAQVHPETWKVMEMKGRMSRFMLKIAPHIPLIRRFFNPEKFYFLAVEGIWYKKGNAGNLNKLFEGICNYMQSHFIMIWADQDCDLCHNLERHTDYGIVSKFFESNKVDVKVSFNNFTEEEKQLFFQKPAYISAYDMV